MGCAEEEGRGEEPKLNSNKPSTNTRCVNITSGNRERAALAAAAKQTKQAAREKQREPLQG